MDFNEYRLKAFLTCNDLKTPQLNLAHMVLGMASELDEIYIAAEVKKDVVNLHEELGDETWYLAGYCTFRVITPVIQYDHAGYTWADLVCAVSTLVDMVKKYVAYGKPIDRVIEQELVNKCFTVIANFTHARTGIGEIFHMNIEKLKGRYPDGRFDKVSAIDRNLDNERNILEQNSK